jgi:hypothetical protein
VALRRPAGRADRADRLEQAAGGRSVQPIDETGWRVGGKAAWLRVFAGDQMTPYHIRPSRGRGVVIEA